MVLNVSTSCHPYVSLPLCSSSPTDKTWMNDTLLVPRGKFSSGSHFFLRRHISGSATDCVTPFTWVNLCDQVPLPHSDGKTLADVRRWGTMGGPRWAGEGPTAGPLWACQPRHKNCHGWRTTLEGSHSSPQCWKALHWRSGK